MIRMGLVCNVVEEPTFVLFAGERGGEPMWGSLLKRVQKRFSIIGREHPDLAVVPYQYPIFLVTFGVHEHVGVELGGEVASVSEHTRRAPFAEENLQIILPDAADLGLCTAGNAFGPGRAVEQDGGGRHLDLSRQIDVDQYREHSSHQQQDYGHDVAEDVVGR